MNKLLEIKDLSITLKKESRRIVKGLNFDLDAGCSLTLLGQSGSGKTLTCKSILGVLGVQFSPAGEILFEGHNLLNLPEKARGSIYGRQIAMIAQNPMTAFDPAAKIGRQMDETLRIHTKLNRTERRSRCLHALSEAGLTHGETVMKSYPFMLSGGMLQRVMIALALMTDAKLIAADEPTTALDVENRNATVDAFIRLRERGTAVLLVTHDFTVAARFGGRILVMNDGEIVEDDAVDNIMKNPQHPYTRELLSASRLSVYGRKEV